MLKTLSFILNHPLNQQGQLAALMRFFRWQVGSRLLPVPHVLPFVNETYLVVERGMTGATGNWYCGLHEHRDMGFVLHLLREDDVFADIGSNVGSYTVLAAGAAGATTFAFEPIPKTFAALERNITANRISARVFAHNVGVGAAETTLQFTSENDTTNHAVRDGSGTEPTITVPVKRLDDIVGDQIPLLIKIDVEGWEPEVLAGMPQILSSPTLKAIIVENNDEDTVHLAESGLMGVGDVMAQHGFQPFSYDPLKRELEKVGGAYSNTIFIRDFDFVRNRLAAAPKFTAVNSVI